MTILPVSKNVGLIETEISERMLNITSKNFPPSHFNYFFTKEPKEEREEEEREEEERKGEREGGRAKDFCEIEM